MKHTRIFSSGMLATYTIFLAQSSFHLIRDSSHAPSLRQKNDTRVTMTWTTDLSLAAIVAFDKIHVKCETANQYGKRFAVEILSLSSGHFAGIASQSIIGPLPGKCRKFNFHASSRSKRENVGHLGEQEPYSSDYRGPVIFGEVNLSTSLWGAKQTFKSESLPILKSLVTPPQTAIIPLLSLISGIRG